MARRSGTVVEGEVRTAILESTEALLAERRFHRLSVAAIIERAGVSRASFYFYFASKHAVLAALVEDQLALVLADWEPWFSGRDEDLRAPLASLVGHWRTHRSLFIACVESWRQDPEVGALWAGTLGRFSASVEHRLREQIAAGRVHTRTPPAMLAELLTWGTERALYLATSGTSSALHVEDPQLHEALVELWQRALS